MGRAAVTRKDKAYKLFSEVSEQPLSVVWQINLDFLFIILLKIKRDFV